MQLQNRFLTHKHQLNFFPEATAIAETDIYRCSTGNLPTVLTAVQEPPVMIPANPVQVPAVEPTAKVAAPRALSTPPPPCLPPSILTSPLTVEMFLPVRKRKW